MERQVALGSAPNIDALLRQPLKERLRQVLVRVDAVRKEDAQRPRLPAPPGAAAKDGQREDKHAKHDARDETRFSHLAVRKGGAITVHEGGVETV